MTNEWKTAVLDALAITHMDAPLDEPPASILKRVIDWHIGLRQADKDAEITALKAEVVEYKRVQQRLHDFLDAAAGEDLEMGGVCAQKLYIELFPEIYFDVLLKGE